MDINKILEGIDCPCGKRHDCDISYVYIEKDAMRHLPEILEGFSKVLLVADENTFAAAGEPTLRYINDKIADRVIFPGDTILIPNEDAIAKVSEHLQSIDYILGIGSGVIQDLCKYVANFNSLPYGVVATAPSMDGYASSGAAMITDGMKVTYSARVPHAIVADSEVIKNAPLEMIKAGYGDIIGKYSALNDWKLAKVINGEYFCQHVYDLTFDMLKATLPLADKLLDRDGESVGILMEALIVVGIAMSFAGSSRPASGSEHHLSHYFEITGIVDGTEYLPHGIDVFYSTYVTSLIREKLAAATFPSEKFVMPEEEKNAEIKRVYKSVADGCIALQKKLGTYEKNLVPTYKEKEEAIKAVLREVPPAETIAKLIKGIGLDLSEFKNIYGEEKILDAIKYAKDLKDRYTVLWTYYDMFGTKSI